MIDKITDAAKEIIYDYEIEGKSKHTIRAYKTTLNQLLNQLKKNPPKSPQELIKAMKAFLAKERRQGKADRTIYLHTVILRTLLRYMKVPEDNLRTPRIGQSIPKALTQEEYKKFTEAIENKKYKLITEILYKTGTRISELVNLKIEDIDFEKRRVTITGKGKKQRTIYIDDKLLKKIKDYTDSSHGRLFNITPAAVQAYFRKTREKAGLSKRVTPHVLRHTYATRLLELGMDIRLIKELLGHSNINTTQIYTRVTESRLRKELEEKLKKF